MPCILVLGTHRSGTSCVAGILHHLGVPMGPRLLGAHWANPRGHFEDEDFLDLHRKIFAEREPDGRPIPRRWRYPDPEFEPHRAAYQALVDARSWQSLWGLKDPRLCHLMPCFLSCYEGRLKVICVNRESEDSALSLHAREHATDPDFTLNEARLIVAGHRMAQRQALKLATERGPALLIGYDMIVDDPESSVAELASFVGVNNIAPALGFVEPALRHWVQS